MKGLRVQSRPPKAPRAFQSLRTPEKPTEFPYSKPMTRSRESDVDRPRQHLFQAGPKERAYRTGNECRPKPQKD